MADRDPRVLAIDAGGTMTDTFIVDGAGAFVVGKAQTTPEDESVGLHGVGATTRSSSGTRAAEEAFPRIVSGIYSRHGDAQPAALAHRAAASARSSPPGNEDYLRLERGIQTYLGFSYSDRLHVATHHHNEPLVPRERMKGVRGRIDVMGDEVMPLREAGRPRRGGRAARRRRRGDLHLPAVRLPQRRARDPRRRRSSPRSRPSGAWTARCRSTSPRSSTRCAATSRG